MPFEHISELAAWMADAGIGELELSGPDRRLLLRLAPDGTATAVTDAAPPAASSGVAIKAPIAGRFLHRHPMAATPLVTAGAEVAAGQIIGLVAIGSLLVPVQAPSGGLIVEITAGHDDIVGYGAALIAFQPLIDPPEA